MSTHYGRPFISGCIPAFMALSAMFACQTSSVRASAVIYEGFDYAAGGINGQNGGTGFDGAWAGSGTAVVETPGQTYGTLVTSGGAVGPNLSANNHFVGARGVSSGLTGLLDDGDELWFSVIMGYGAGNATNTTLAFALGTAGFTTGNYTYQIAESGGTGLGVFMGRFSGVNYQASAAQFTDTSAGTGFSGITYGAPSGVEFDEGPRLVVGKFTWGATEDTITLYLPDTNLNLGDGVSTLTVNVNQAAFDTITAERGDKVVMDEIRFGATMADVLPVPEPASVGLLTLAAGFGLLRRRR